MHPRSHRFIFKLAKPEDKQRIISWLEQEHIQKWLHGTGLKNLLQNLDKFFKGTSDSQHWIAYDRGTPFAYLLTSPEGKDAITLDLFICDLKFLGKGLAVPMIKDFLISQFSDKKEVLIDPEAANTRAIHVYQKAGFKIVGEFIASWHPVPHFQMRLFMKDLLERDL